jgi:hypothetical protein
MVLRDDVTRLRVQHKRDISAMVWRKNQGIHHAEACFNACGAFLHPVELHKAPILDSQIPEFVGDAICL